MSRTIAVCLEYPLALRGGVSVLVETMLPALAQHYRVVLVSPDTAQSLARCGAGGVLARHFSWDPAAISRATSRQLAEQLAKEGVALAHFHLGGIYGWGNRQPGLCPMTHLAKLRVRTCTTVHSVSNALDGYCGPQKPLWFKLGLLPLAWLAKMRVLCGLRAEVTVSRHNCAVLQKRYWPLRGRFRVIYHSRVRLPVPPASSPREPTILNVGHIAERKGQLVLVQAFAQVAVRNPDWKLCLVGYIAEEAVGEQIRAIAKQHNVEDRIVLLGDRDDTFELMSRAGIYVQPSLSEALGLALQEALFAGCPSIGSRVGGIPELIDHGTNGILVAPGNATDLAHALEALISDPAAREHYGRAALQTIATKGMTFDHMVKQHLELYESILQGS